MVFEEVDLLEAGDRFGEKRLQVRMEGKRGKVFFLVFAFAFWSKFGVTHL